MSSTPNPYWLARAALFESKGIAVRCKRGHNTLTEGIYFFTQTQNGKKYSRKRCARCVIENVQAWRRRKRALAMKKAA